MIAVIDYKAGNLTSVRLAFEALNAPVEVTSDPTVIDAAERVVFPGVGAAGAAVHDLNELRLRPAIEQAARSGKPFLGICLGTQILLDSSEEDGGTACLGLVPGRVKRFRPNDHFDKIPQMGWNTVVFRREHPVFAGIESRSEFYFVHSYYPAPDHRDHWLAETEYADAAFASIVGRGNLIATQFHPERSGRIGLKLLENFVNWDGTC